MKLQTTSMQRALQLMMMLPTWETTTDFCNKLKRSSTLWVSKQGHVFINFSKLSVILQMQRKKLILVQPRRRPHLNRATNSFETSLSNLAWEEPSKLFSRSGTSTRPIINFLRFYPRSLRFIAIMLRYLMSLQFCRRNLTKRGLLPKKRDRPTINFASKEISKK